MVSVFFSFWGKRKLRGAWGPSPSKPAAGLKFLLVTFLLKEKSLRFLLVTFLLKEK